MTFGEFIPQLIHGLLLVLAAIHTIIVIVIGIDEYSGPMVLSGLAMIVLVIIDVLFTHLGMVVTFGGAR